MNCFEAAKFVPRPEILFNSKHTDNKMVIADMTDTLLETGKMYFSSAKKQVIFII